MIHRYEKAARELWKFCFRSGSSYTLIHAKMLEEMTASGERHEWWEAAEPRHG